MSIRDHLKRCIHRELFSLDQSTRQAFQYALLNEQLRDAFSANGHPLGKEISFSQGSTSRKWKLADGKKSYLIKDLGDHLVVIREKIPSLCRLLEFSLYEAKPRYYLFRWKLRRWRSQRVWALKKRFVDRPSRLMVNLGAGVWYADGWKVLDCQGGYYHYAHSYIDFEHDLTSDRPLPFADGSVHMFYTEHV